MRIHHLALRVADLERSREFYSGLLQLPLLRENREETGRLRSLWLRAGDAILMLERTLAGAGPESGSGHVLAFATEDVEAFAQRLAAAGVALDGRTRFTLYFRDPDGHRVGVSSYRE